jgi:hypothetical protein
MRQTRTWLFVFLPFLYLALVLALIAVQFSKKTDSFTQSLGDLTIAGKAASGASPAELTLRGRGVEFLFDGNHVLAVDGKNGPARLRPVSWAWKDGNVVVTFQQGLQLAFDKSDRTLLIHPVANDALKSFTLARIPFGPQGGTRINRGSRDAFVEVVRDKDRQLASVDGVQDKIDVDNSFVLTAGKNGFRPARLDPLTTSPDLAWITLDSASDPTAAEAALTQYWNKAYVGWSSATAISSKLVDAWGREALLRGDYPSAIAKIQALQSRDQRAWGFDAVSYLGDIVSVTAQQRQAVEAASSRTQPDWTGQGRLWSDARLYGPAGSADRVKDLLVKGKLPDAAPALIAVLQNLAAIQALQPSDAVASRVQDVQAALLTKVVRREGDLFVRTADGLLDLRSSLLLGRQWMDLSRTLADQSYASAGAQLVVSALANQDAAGRLPEILVTQDGKIVRQEGNILPEEIYAAVKPAPAPETELPAWGPQAFVRTPAVIVSKAITDADARFTFRFPTGTAEHIVIAGVPAFDHITMHGIRWRTDPQFQSYTDGWAYSASTKTLYVKIKHREDLEELIVHFQPEQ